MPGYIRRSTPIIVRLASILILLILFGPLPVVQAVSSVPDLLVPPPAGLASQDLPSIPPPPWTSRSRRMALDTRVLDSLQPDQASYTPIRLALFPDAAITFQPESIHRGTAGGAQGFVLSGRIPGQPDSLVILSWQDGILDGHISLPGPPADPRPVFYQIHYDASSHLEVVEQIDQAGFPQEEDLVLSPAAGADLAAGIAPQADTVQTETGSRVDIQVYYDSAALNGVGGPAAMNNLLNTAIAESNAGFANSGVKDRFNLVYSALTNYDESNFNITTALTRLTAPSDGYMDEVHSTRNTYAADLTIFLVNNTDSACGISWVMSSLSTGFASSAFSVVAASCATGYYSFAHEAGHVMGSVHDRANASSPGVFSYSYGYQDPGKAFRTIMAYTCASPGCPRINYWSNPGISYNGKPTGVDPSNASSAADNSLSLNNTLSTVINFRPAPAPKAPTGLSYILSPGPRVQLNWSDASFNEDGFSVERSPRGLGIFTPVWTTAMNSVQATDSSLSTCGGGYDYRVRAFNSDGTSGPTNTVTVSLPACQVAGFRRIFLPVVSR